MRLLPDANLSHAFLSRSAYVLIFANLVPLVGVLFFGWSISVIIFAYWTEVLAVGFFNVFKMLMIGTYQKTGELSFIIPFFILHYGLFSLVDGFFLLKIFGPIPNDGLLLIPALSLFLSHSFSFVDNFLIKKQYKTRSLGSQMFSPYRRIVVVQVTAIVGGAAVVEFGTPLAGFVVMIIAKTAVDLYSHGSTELKQKQTDENAKLNFPKLGKS